MNILRPKTLFLHHKNVVFTSHKQCFYHLKTMVLELKTYVFTPKIRRFCELKNVLFY